MFKYKYDDNWILNNYSSFPNNKELCDAYNVLTNQDINYKAFVSYMNRNLGMAGKRNDVLLYTKEQDEWLKENYFKYGNYCFDEFNKKFGTNRGKKPLLTHCKRMGFRVDKKVSDLHQLGNTKRERKVGDIWKDSKTGFWMIKVAKIERNQYASIKRYHRYIWEQSKGEIPKGHKVIFLDGDIDNCTIENLACVPSSYLVLMNKNKLKSENPKITETAIKWCELYIETKTEV